MNQHYLLLLFSLVIKIQLISGQICQKDISDYFYNVNFAGPIFDQSLYIVTASNFSVSSRNDTHLFYFNVQPQNNYTRPSFIPANVSGRALRILSDNITVIANDPNFSVISLGNDSYTLIPNIFPLNYFSPFNRYLFNLTAKQTFSDRPPVTSTAVVQINLKNDNVNAPIFIQDNQRFYISETASPGTTFGTVYATDADNDSIIYSISSNSQFTIDPSTGVLELQRIFLASSPSEYLVTVTAKDDGSSCSPPCPKYEKSTDITINVTAVNQQSPLFLNNICGSTIPFDENHAIGQTIGWLNVSDDDRGENGQIEISFPLEESRQTVSGRKNTAYSQFYLELLNQTNTTRVAMLKTNKTFDYDKPGATRVWYLFVLATDHGKPQRQSFCSLRINLVDLNDNSPVFAMTFWNYTIYNTTNMPFLRIIASDADSGVNGIINYYIGTINVPYFIINQTTGTIIFRSDISGISSLNITLFPIRFQVYALDRGSPQRMSENNATVIIYCNNGNDSSPAQWLYPSYEEINFTIREKFYEKCEYRSIFSNETGFNGSIIYELTSQTSSIMTVYSPFFEDINIPFSDLPVERNGKIFSSGIVVTSGLHAEIQNVYFLYIRVLVTPPLIRSVTIRLIDENDQIPTFDIRSITLSVVQKETGNRTIARIQAFDRDIDYPNNHIDYYLNQNLSDTEAIGKFIVNLDGTIWTNTTFGGENNRTFYRIFIRASDGAPAWNSPTNNTQDFQVDIQVISINDKPPVFVNGPSVTVHIKEIISNGTNILNLTIIDLDINTTLNLGILSGNSFNAFTFTLLSDNSDNLTRTQYEAIGQVKVVARLSYKSRSNYILVLFAFDTQNIAKIDVIVTLEAQNTNAPYFTILDPGIYQFEVIESTPMSSLNGPDIEAVDPDDPPTTLVYEIYNTNHQLDLSSVKLNQSKLSITSPGLSRDPPFGSSEYNFSIRVTDENGTGVSSYAPVSIKVIDINNNAPIPVNSPWFLNETTPNPDVEVLFKDYDDQSMNNTLPYTVLLLDSPQFTLTPTSNNEGKFKLTYIGILNRTLTKNLTVTFNASDNKDKSENSTISIIVGDLPDNYPISDGFKTINIIYVNGYENSLRNVSLGSVYVNDLDDWYRADNQYSLINNNMFETSQGLLTTSERLCPGSYTIRVNVTKPNVSVSAVSTIDLHARSIDSEYVRQASTIRIQGEYPETLIDLTLDKLSNVLASLLSVNIDSIIILAVRPVFQYRSPYYRPLPFEDDKKQALTDVIFYVPTLNKFDIEDKLNKSLDLFKLNFQIIAIASGPNPCKNYNCPTGTICRPTRTVHPKPSAIDTNRTSFVGINILDSADCVNSTSVSLMNIPNECTYYSSTSSPSCGPLERTFDENGGGYATYLVTTFGNFAPTRFSFDFVLRTSVIDGLILLYGKNTIPINDFLWIAIEIYQSKLRFHFRETIRDADNTTLNASTWYHVEYQFVSSTVLVSINDCQYSISVNNTSDTYNLSNVELYLGGLPKTGSLVSGLYPSLTQVNTFSGCIRNVLLNGNYLNMSNATSFANSNSGGCPCSVTNSCSTRTERLTDIIIPWYTWLIIALVLLLFTMIFVLTLLTLIRKRRQLKSITGLYTDDTRDNVIDYKDSAGEEDHSAYNLRILKKPIYTLTDDNTVTNNGGSGINNPGYIDTMNNNRPSLGEYINKKLSEQQILSYANDTQLRYGYEGEGSIASDLSSIESSSVYDGNDYRFLYSLGPKFSRLANDMNNDNT